MKFHSAWSHILKFLGEVGTYHPEKKDVIALLWLPSPLLSSTTLILWVSFSSCTVTGAVSKQLCLPPRHCTSLNHAGFPKHKHRIIHCHKAPQNNRSCLWMLHPRWDKVPRVDSGVEWRELQQQQGQRSHRDEQATVASAEGTELGHWGALLLSAQATAQSPGTLQKW